MRDPVAAVKMHTKCIFPEGNLLANFARHCCPSGVDKEEKDKRDSVQSGDSGIEKDLKESDFNDTEQHPVRNPGPAIPGSSPALKEDRRRHTARVVVMGDDRALGRLARAYLSIRLAAVFFMHTFF